MIETYVCSSCLIKNGKIPKHMKRESVVSLGRLTCSMCGRKPGWNIYKLTDNGQTSFIKIKIND